MTDPKQLSELIDRFKANTPSDFDTMQALLLEIARDTRRTRSAVRFLAWLAAIVLIAQVFIAFIG